MRCEVRGARWKAEGAKVRGVNVAGRCDRTSKEQPDKAGSDG